MEIKRCYDTIVGASVGENQLVQSARASTEVYGLTITRSTDGTADTIAGTATDSGNITICSSVSLIANHVYIGSIGTPSVTGFVVNFGGIGTVGLAEKIYKPSENRSVSVNVTVASGTAINATVRPQIIDLTALLGSTIADYIYSLESATAGSGISKLREWGFLKGYQAFNSGSIESVEVTGKKVVGFNQWNEEWESGYYDIADGSEKTSSSWARNKELISVVPNTEYTFKANTSESVGGIGYILFYDGSKQYINSYVQMQSALYGTTGQQFTVPSNACYIGFYMNVAWQSVGICINLSSSRNGEYEAYSEQEYDYGTDTLNGIFKLDANNNLYADGDVKTSDGTITRYYGTRAYQSGDESLADAITDGTTTVYKLTTPTTEQGDPFPSPQIVYPDGTEEYVTSNGVPVGHETRYEL